MTPTKIAAGNMKKRWKAFEQKRWRRVASRFRHATSPGLGAPITVNPSVSLSEPRRPSRHRSTCACSTALARCSDVPNVIKAKSSRSSSSGAPPAPSPRTRSCSTRAAASACAAVSLATEAGVGCARSRASVSCVWMLSSFSHAISRSRQRAACTAITGRAPVTVVKSFSAEVGSRLPRPHPDNTIEQASTRCESCSMRPTSSILCSSSAYSCDIFEVGMKVEPRSGSVRSTASFTLLTTWRTRRPSGTSGRLRRSWTVLYTEPSKRRNWLYMIKRIKVVEIAKSSIACPHRRSPQPAAVLASKLCSGR